MKNLKKKNIAVISIFSILICYIVGHLYFILQDDQDHPSSSPTLTSAAFAVPEAPLEKVKAVYYEQFVPEKKALNQLNRKLEEKLMADSILNLKGILETQHNIRSTLLNKASAAPEVSANQKTVAQESTPKELGFSKTTLIYKRRLVAAAPKTSSLFKQASSYSASQHKTTFEAMVFGAQEIKSGGQVKLILNQDFNWAGFSIPKNSFIFPLLKLDNELATLSLSIAGQEFVANIYQPAGNDSANNSNAMARMQVGRELKKEVVNETVNQISRVASAKIPFLAGITSGFSRMNHSNGQVNSAQITFPNKMKLVFIQQ